MGEKRCTDGEETELWFRSERMIIQGGNWFFETREGTFEGPFESEAQARQALERYVHKHVVARQEKAGLLSLEPL